MSAVYSLRSHKLDNFIVTKFDDDFNIESYYEMTVSDGVVRCGCPAGARPSCRHRQMFTQLLERMDTAWFLDFDTRQWVDPTGEAALSQPEPEPASTPLRTVVEESPKDLWEPILGKHEGKYLGSHEGTPVYEVEEIKPRDDHPFRRRM